MSYCRWSDDDWRSDIYAYEGESGFVVHVAACRRVGEIPHVDNTLLFDNPQKWLDAHNQQMDAVHKSSTVRIDLPHAGETFFCETIEEFLLKMNELREIGYNVPQFAIDEIQEEIKAKHEKI